MTLLEMATLIPRNFKSDPRGWFLKVLTGTEDHITPGTGEIYLTMSHAGQIRGGHYHPKANEWFTALRGRARVLLTDPISGKSIEVELSAQVPQTLFVPAGLAHTITSDSQDASELWLLAYSDEQYDPDDTIPYPVSN